MSKRQHWKEIIQKRLEACETCPAFRKAFRRCSKCGCFVDAKARMPLNIFDCPLKRWDFPEMDLIK